MVVGKRQTKRSEKILESEKQDEEMSPKKKKKKNKENDISNETGTEKQAEVSQKKNKKKNKADDSLTETNSSKPEVTVAKLKADQKKSEINAEKENSEAVLKELAGTAMENQFFNSSSKNVNATMHKEGISESQNLHNIIVPVTSPESCTKGMPLITSTPSTSRHQLDMSQLDNSLIMPIIPYQARHTNSSHSDHITYSMNTPVNELGMSQLDCNTQMPLPTSTNYTNSTSQYPNLYALPERPSYYQLQPTSSRGNTCNQPISHSPATNLSETVNLAMGATRAAWNVDKVSSPKSTKSQAVLISPSPPEEILHLYEILLKPRVRDYMEKFCEYFGRNQKQAELKDFEEDFETLDSQYDNDTEPTSPSILETRSTNSFSASFNKEKTTIHDYDMNSHSGKQAQLQLSPRRSPRGKSDKTTIQNDDSSTTTGNDQSGNNFTIQFSPRRSPRGKSDSIVPVQGTSLGPKRQLLKSPKKIYTSSSTMVKLIESADVTVDGETIKKIMQKAHKESSPGYFIIRKVMPLLFSRGELANSRGQGLTTSKDGDFRPALDKTRVKIAKDYVRGWCKINQKTQPSEEELNKGVTEAVGYARKALKKQNN
ncbi:uncharacterized protein LOC143051528 isoform X2 [Mytilus galloprovincialis]